MHPRADAPEAFVAREGATSSKLGCAVRHPGAAAFARAMECTAARARPLCRRSPPLAARRKLIMVDTAAFLEALSSPPGNHLEALKGDLAGKHSIRINDQWRVVFRWTDAGPEDVEIIDYH
jgi:plasmid maintenance system killer protein